LIVDPARPDQKFNCDPLIFVLLKRRHFDLKKKLTWSKLEIQTLDRVSHQTGSENNGKNLQVGKHKFNLPSSQPSFCTDNINLLHFQIIAEGLAFLVVVLSCFPVENWISTSTHIHA